MKASEKQELTKKLATRLEKQFGPPRATPERSVLDTAVYSVCLENDSPAAADRSFAALRELFHDLNEIRVSSISELVAAFAGQSDPELRAHRVRSVLQYVFEEHFEFDLESIRKKTQEQAAKKLSKIRGLSPFVRNYIQQAALGAHLVPMDDRMTAAAVWLGLVEPGTSTETAADALKPAVRKSDAAAFCYLLRCLVAEPPGRSVFEPANFSVPKEGYSSADALRRVEDLLGGKTRGSTKAKSEKPVKKPVKAAAKPKPPAKAKSASTVAKRSAPAKKPKGRSRAAS